MDERKPKSIKDDDVPIIGDYSAAANARLRPDPQLTSPPRPARSPPSPQRAAGPAGRAGAEQWRPDPSDVRRHAERIRQRERVGPLGKLVRYGVVAATIAGAFAVYWNFETLRGITVDLSALTSLFANDSGRDGTSRRPLGGEPEPVNVEAAGVVGAAIATSLGDAPPAAEPSPLPIDLAATQTAAAAVSTAEPPAQQAVPVSSSPPPPAAPETPPAPETFHFGLGVLNVSESDPSAAVVILRDGGRRGSSSVTWWTKDGTAKAGTDYADLGRVVVKFAAGEQNHTIHIPLVGDSNVEGPETFYVYLVKGESLDGATDERAEQLEVIINDAR